MLSAGVDSNSRLSCSFSCHGSKHVFSMPTLRRLGCLKRKEKATNNSSSFLHSYLCIQCIIQRAHKLSSELLSEHFMAFQFMGAVLTSIMCVTDPQHVCSGCFFYLLIAAAAATAADEDQKDK